MNTVHWLGAGLSSIPGIRRLATAGTPLTLWNRTLSKAEAALEGLDSQATAKQFDVAQLASTVQAGDVVVSMLPANMHPNMARLCLDKGSHFVSSSYISPELQDMDAAAKESQLCLVNECGLDPGLDHLMAHLLVDRYKSSAQFNPQQTHSFRSYCGGFPKIPNEFKYKFSWSPLGVLRELRSPAKWIANGQPQTTDTPWKSLQDYHATLPGGPETFQSYPNRDSLPFMSEYGFGDEWNVQEFVRGTLRLNGWDQAWADIFALVEESQGEAGQQDLAAKSDELWANYRYADGEPDRVVLSVDLQVEDQGQTVWHQAYCLDEAGNENGSAMARLVSLTVSIAVQAVLAGDITTGVSAAPKQPATAQKWLDQMAAMGETFQIVELA